MNAPEQDGQRLKSANRDFPLRWHLVTLGAVTAALLLLYFASKKLIFG